MQLFGFGGIEIDLFPYETVSFSIIDSDEKSVFGLVLVVDLNFL